MYKAAALLCIGASVSAVAVASQQDETAVACPLNILRGVTATQSSTYVFGPSAEAKNAVDGSPICIMNYEFPLQNTLSSTNVETNPWW